MDADMDRAAVKMQSQAHQTKARKDVEARKRLIGRNDYSSAVG